MYRAVCSSGISEDSRGGATAGLSKFSRPSALRFLSIAGGKASCLTLASNLQPLTSNLQPPSPCSTTSDETIPMNRAADRRRGGVWLCACTPAQEAPVSEDGDRDPDRGCPTRPRGWTRWRRASRRRKSWPTSRGCLPPIARCSRSSCRRRRSWTRCTCARSGRETRRCCSISSATRRPRAARACTIS